MKFNKKYNTASIIFTCLLMLVGIGAIALTFINMDQYSSYLGYAGIVLLVASLITSFDGKSNKLFYILGLYLAFAFWGGGLLYAFMCKETSLEIANPILFNNYAMGVGAAISGLVGFILSIMAAIKKHNAYTGSKPNVIITIILGVLIIGLTIACYFLYKANYIYYAKYVLAGTFALGLALGFGQISNSRDGIHGLGLGFSYGMPLIGFVVGLYLCSTTILDTNLHLLILIISMSLAVGLGLILTNVSYNFSLDHFVYEYAPKVITVFHYIVSILMILAPIGGITLIVLDYMSIANYIILACFIYMIIIFIFTIIDGGMQGSFFAVTFLIVGIGVSLLIAYVASLSYASVNNPVGTGMRLGVLLTSLIFAIFDIVNTSKKYKYFD